MQRLVELFITGDPEKTKSLFRSAVFGDILSGLAEGKIGQYDPGRAGGYNQGMEIETKEFKINPWDFALAIEGSLFLAGAVARRNPTEDRSRFTIPFTVLFSAVGFSSSAYLESGRYETWLPVWRNPASFPEIKYLFAEGRASLGRRVAKTGIEFSRAVGKLGVDRGIHSNDMPSLRGVQAKAMSPCLWGVFLFTSTPVWNLLMNLIHPLCRWSSFCGGSLRSIRKFPQPSFLPGRESTKPFLPALRNQTPWPSPTW
jgi:CRISPR-associated protein Csx17